jgi:hypothetical protein
MAENGLDFIFLLKLDVGILHVSGISGLLLVEFLKVVNIVHVVGYFAASTRDSNVLSGLTRLLLTFVCASAIV